jgi:hypothetical protein
MHPGSIHKAGTETLGGLNYKFTQTKSILSRAEGGCREVYLLPSVLIGSSWTQLGEQNALALPDTLLETIH